MRLTILLVISVFYCVGSQAETTKSCDEINYRQFDFWLGHWNVYSNDGKKVGENRISIAMNGCVLKEHYTTDKGYEGESLTIFNQQKQEWHQTWVDNSGTLLQLDGSWNGKTMTLQGEGRSKEGQPIIHRIKWVPKKNGDVHQIWDTSSDKGLHWNNAFYGVYQKQSRKNAE